MAFDRCDALRHPQVGLLLTLVFAQQVAFGGFQQFLALFTLVRLGMSATGNAVVFIVVGILLVMVQGVLIGRLSRRFGEARLIKAGLFLLMCSFLLTATTPPVTVPWYSKERVTAELGGPTSLPGSAPPTHTLAITLAAGYRLR
jgi:predicted MFS family arabinose efflux permease